MKEGNLGLDLGKDISNVHTGQCNAGRAIVGVERGETLPTIATIVFWLGTVLCAGAGAYFGSYLKKKGENLATKEDIADLTRVTKEIEARILNEVWDRQRHWELKRDAVLAAIEAMEAAKEGLMRYCAVRESIKRSKIEEKGRSDLETVLGRWNDLVNAFDLKRVGTMVICSEEFSAALWIVRQSLRSGFSGIAKNQIASYDEIGASIRDGARYAISLARIELGMLPIEATSQSSESSAAPTPD